MLIKYCKENDIKYFSKEYISKGDSVLDIGCADGKSYNIISQEVDDIMYYGIDYPYWERKDIDLVESSKTKFIKGDAHSLPFSDDIFDSVIMSHTLEHMYDVNGVLSEISRVMKKDGEIIVIVPLQGKNMSGYLFKYRNPLNFLLPFADSIGLVDYTQPGEGHNQFHSYQNWKDKLCETTAVKESYAWGGLKMLSYILLNGYYIFLSSILSIFNINLPPQSPVPVSKEWARKNKKPYIVATYILEIE